jgi:hypothetical protein
VEEGATLKLTSLENRANLKGAAMEDGATLKKAALENRANRKGASMEDGATLKLAALEDRATLKDAATLKGVRGIEDVATLKGAILKGATQEDGLLLVPVGSSTNERQPAHTSEKTR